MNVSPGLNDDDDDAVLTTSICALQSARVRKPVELLFTEYIASSLAVPWEADRYVALVSSFTSLLAICANRYFCIDDGETVSHIKWGHSDFSEYPENYQKPLHDFCTKHAY